MIMCKRLHTNLDKQQTEFTDLSHHRACRSAYGGSYFGCHSRYAPIKVAYNAYQNVLQMVV